MRFNLVMKSILLALVLCLALTACAQPIPAPTQIAQPLDSAAISQILDETQTQVAVIRGLQAPADLPRSFLSTDEIRQKVETEFLTDYTPEEAARDSKSLWLLGLLPKDFELLSFYHDLYAEQIGGYYDDDTKSMYVVQSGAFTILERSTYAHEFVHALQDQNFEFKDSLRYTDEACDADSERCAALQALIEGDASYTETLWFNQHASNQDIADLQSAYLTMDLPVYNSAPAYIRDDLTFAYFYGAKFVTNLYAQGGYTAIDKAFTELPPLSTEQILHPSRYPDDKPIPVELPDLAGKLGKDWTVLETDSLGEWFTWLLLARGNESNNRLNDMVASAAVEGWGGDQYTILRHEVSGEHAIILSYLWDTPTDQQEAFLAFKDWLTLRFGVPDSSQKYVSSDITARLKINNSTGFYLVITEKPTTTDSLMRLLP